MKIFISYSRDDKAWVHELHRALRERARHDAWIDQDIVPAQDWWETILESVEAREVFVYVMTPMSLASIYCRAELAYAVALNKPIIPLMLKPCENPPILKSKRVQYETIQEGMSLDRVLLSISQAIIEIVQNKAKYLPPDLLPERPPEPVPDVDVAETFTLAEEAASANDFEKAEKWFQQVIDADPDGAWGRAARTRLNELGYERARERDYARIARMAASPALLNGARAVWREFVIKYGTRFDPLNLKAKFEDQDDDERRDKPPVVTPPKPKRPTPVELMPKPLMPKPFAWIQIPKGKVTLKTGKTFDVPAFSIAKYPVTNTQFAEFIKAGGYDNSSWWTDAGWQRRQKEKWTEPRYWTDSKWNKADHPIVGVSWYEAIAFCLWVSEVTGENVTLPTEQGWQRAAQGDDGWAYPWGNKWDGKRCNNNVDSKGIGATTPVTEYEGKNKGDSPYGVTDMSGNVWEWCLTAYKTGETGLNGTDVRVLRGGSWSGSGSDNFRADYRYGDDPFGRNYFIGFRVVSS